MGICCTHFMVLLCFQITTVLPCSKGDCSTWSFSASHQTQMLHISSVFQSIFQKHHYSKFACYLVHFSHEQSLGMWEEFIMWKARNYFIIWQNAFHLRAIGLGTPDPQGKSWSHTLRFYATTVPPISLSSLINIGLELLSNAKYSLLSNGNFCHLNHSCFPYILVVKMRHSGENVFICADEGNKFDYKNMPCPVWERHTKYWQRWVILQNLPSES